MLNRLALIALIIHLLSAPCLAQEKLAKGEAASIAEEAFVYAVPLVMNYAIMNEYFIDKTSKEYKCPVGELYNNARVYTPKDTAVVTPNSDTPYSFACPDLRAEPMVITVPEIEKSRYYSVQLVDMYTFNYGYIGSRATGNGAGSFLIAGPRWKGEAPEGIKKVFRCETDFGTAIFRTQLFDANDIDNVKKIQAGYKVETLSAYLKRAAPAAAGAIDWPAVSKKSVVADPFTYLSFLLQFCPATGPAEVEVPLRARFARIGIEAGKPYPSVVLTDDEKMEVMAGMKAGFAKIKKELASFGTKVNGWRISTSGFGDRAANKGNWTMRAAAAVAGIYGNDAAEALYPILVADSEGNRPDCKKHDYTLTFPADQLPPANFFWSVTMYGRTQLLIENPMNRYLINSPMLPNLKKNADGSLTLYLQKNSPGKDKESNWLPAPDGPIYCVMRLYGPKAEALDGTWKPPAAVPAK
jgi:hypothetical protein